MYMQWMCQSLREWQGCQPFRRLSRRVGQTTVSTVTVMIKNKDMRSGAPSLFLLLILQAVLLRWASQLASPASPKTTSLVQYSHWRVLAAVKGAGTGKEWSIAGAYFNILWESKLWNIKALFHLYFLLSRHASDGSRCLSVRCQWKMVERWSNHFHIWITGDLQHENH